MLENDDCRPIKRKEHCIRYYLINPTGPAGVSGPTGPTARCNKSSIYIFKW